ncbi:MAG: endonuclease/exonuclease/phosphatase family protein [Treponema sp.]|jgi:endonuclease/exonuclease/phosphatase family metal-dependent hydrolase|nr:endonuclease/exonuclease/phosphatase family protein [Treponema sp.]
MRQNNMVRIGRQALSAILLAAALVSLVSLVSCEFFGMEEAADSEEAPLSIMTWNLQALFDGTEAGTEYDEYTAAADWSEEKYRGRISVISKAIQETESGIPDLIALEEIESGKVLDDLGAALSKKAQFWTHFAANPGGSLGLGLISKFPLEDVKVHSINADGDEAPRPVLEVRVDAGGRPLALFVCHWKSKLGGDDATETTRKASARIILRRLRELAEEEPSLPVIILGDLNENYDEFYRRNGSVISALVPDDPHCADITGFYGPDGEGPAESAPAAELQKDFIILSSNKPPRAHYFPEQTICVYSPWAKELENGSYYYKNEWETIDHFLLSTQLFDGTGWEFENARVFNQPPFGNAKGQPAAYNPRTGAGLSDHLPLLLFLSYL